MTPRPTAPRAIVALLLACLMLVGGADLASAAQPPPPGSGSCQPPGSAIGKQATDALNAEFQALNDQITIHNSEPHDFSTGQKALFDAYNAEATALNTKLDELRQRAQDRISIPESLAAEACEKLIRPQENATTPSGTPDPRNMPRGTPKIPRGSTTKVRSDNAENQSARLFAQKGYDIEQLADTPGVEKQNRPDFLIEGRLFDNKTPETKNVEQVFDTVRKSAKDKQAFRFVLNMDVNDQLHDSAAITNDAIKAIFERKGMRIGNLNEVLIVRNGEITTAFLRPG